MSADETINCDRVDEVGNELQKAMVSNNFAELTLKRSAIVLPLSAMPSTIKVRGEAVVIDQQQMLNRGACSSPVRFGARELLSV